MVLRLSPSLSFNLLILIVSRLLLVSYCTVNCSKFVGWNELDFGLEETCMFPTSTMPTDNKYRRPSHPLSRFYEFPAFQIGQARFESIEQGVQQAAFIQHRLSVPEPPSLQCHSKSVLVEKLEELSRSPNPDLLVQTPLLYRSVMDFLIHSGNNPFAEEIQHLARRAGGRVQFIEPGDCAVWSDNVSVSEAESGVSARGFALYPEVVSTVLEDYRRGYYETNFVHMSLENLLLDPFFFPSSQFSRVGILIGDSQLRHVASIDGFRVMPTSGATCHTVSQEITNSINLFNQRVLIINVGINDARRSVSFWNAGWNALLGSIRPVVNSPNIDVVFNGPVYTPRSENVETYSQFLHQKVTNLHAENLHFIDWASVSRSNPFTTHTSRQGFNGGYVARDGYHISKEGFWYFWDEFCALLPRLKPLEVKLYDTPYNR